MLGIIVVGLIFSAIFHAGTVEPCSRAQQRVEKQDGKRVVWYQWFKLPQFYLVSRVCVWCMCVYVHMCVRVCACVCACVPYGGPCGFFPVPHRSVFDFSHFTYTVHNFTRSYSPHVFDVCCFVSIHACVYAYVLYTMYVCTVGARTCLLLCVCANEKMRNTELRM